MRRLIKAGIWGATFAFLCWLLGLQPSWQLLALVVGCVIVDNMLDEWLPTSSNDAEHTQALIAADEAGYQRGVQEMQMRNYSTGKPA